MHTPRQLPEFLVTACLVMGFAGVAGASEWRLAGTILEGDGAALVEADGRQVFLRIDEMLAGCVLQAVAASRASFLCPDEEFMLELGAARTAGSQQAGGDAINDGESVLLDRDRTLELMKERQRLVSEVPLEPVVRDARITGYRLRGVRPDSLTARAGFSEGDVLLSVNGVAADAGTAFTQVLNNLKDAHQVTIVFERDGRHHEKLVLLD